MPSAIPEKERLKFIRALDKAPKTIKPLALVMILASLRVGEALGLKWENIDFENKTIQVKNGITQVPQFDNKGHVLSRVTVIGYTKTACSVREVPIPDILILMH